MGETVVAVSIGHAQLRLMRSDSGYVVHRSLPKPASDAVAITRHRFASSDESSAARQLFLDALACAETVCTALQQQAHRAIARHVAGMRTMRAGSEAMRVLKRDAEGAVAAYLRDGAALAQQCFALEEHLIERGLAPGDIPVPVWLATLMQDVEGHQKGTSSSEASPHETAGSSESSPGSRAGGLANR